MKVVTWWPKRRWLLAIVVVIGLLGPTLPAKAEIFKSRPLRSQTFTLGIEPTITLSGDADFSLFMHGGYGFGSGYAVHIKLGFAQSPLNDDDVHISGMLEIDLYQRRGSPFGLFFAVGGSNWGDGSLEAQLVMNLKLQPVTLYTGFDQALRFVDSGGGTDVQLPILWAIGIDVPIHRRTHIMVEGGVDLNESSNFLSGGVRFFF